MRVGEMIEKLDSQGSMPLLRNLLGLEFESVVGGRDNRGILVDPLPKTPVTSMVMIPATGFAGYCISGRFKKWFAD